MATQVDGWGEGSITAEEVFSRDVELIEPMKVLITNGMAEKICFAEIGCSNPAFASRLHDKTNPLSQTDTRSGELDL